MYVQNQNEKTIMAITQYETECVVRRNGKEYIVNSLELVPGDVLLLAGMSDWIIPADMIVVEGSAIMNESGLTGESMPVQKTACLDDDERFDPEHSDAKHLLFAGTKTLQVSEKCEAIVTATSTDTSKGQLVTTILFPKKSVFRYEEELDAVSLFMLFLGIIAFLCNFLFITYNGSSTFWVVRWASSMFTITQLFSPLLPVALKVGQIRSTDRLVKKDINCLSPRHIAICGKLNIFGFDKTGTLTKEGLEYNACCFIETDKNGTSSLRKAESIADLNKHSMKMIEGMATCHALAKYGDDEYVGNQVEVNMFKAVGWRMVGDSVRSSQGGDLTIVRKFEFDHGKQMMSVIVNGSEGARIFSKGSFEKIADLCDPKTVPISYMKEAREFAIQGGYVLALATKKYEFPEDCDKKAYASKLKRESIETNGDFELLGLIIFRNEPKSDSAYTMSELRGGSVRPVMITGDNAFCGQYIAHTIGMIDAKSRVLLAEKGKKKGDTIKWKFIGEDDSPVYTTDMVLDLKNEETGGCFVDGERIELGVTGNDCLEALYKDKKYMSPEFIRLQTEIRIFARVSPEHKTWIIEKFRQTGHIVGMCGDGGNDCGALRAAHAGIALSEAEASAVSPFTSKSKMPTSVIDLVKEGRASLATSFANYKFLITYGFCFVTAKLTMNWYGVLMSNWCFFTMDAIIATTVSYVMTLTKPLDTLSTIRPTSSLLGPITVASETGTVVIFLISFISSFLLMMNQPGYQQWPAEYSDGGTFWFNSDNWESSVVFGSVAFFTLYAALSFSLGYEFRQPLMKDHYVVGLLSAYLIIFWCMFLTCPNDFNQLWHIASADYNVPNGPNIVWNKFQANGGEPSPPMDLDLRTKFCFMWLGFGLMNFLWQLVVLNGFVGDKLREKYPNKFREPYLC